MFSTRPRDYIFRINIVLVIITTHTKGIFTQMAYGVCAPCQSSKEENVGEMAVPCNLCPTTDCAECCSSCRNIYDTAQSQLVYIPVPFMGGQNSYDYTGNYYTGSNFVDPSRQNTQLFVETRSTPAEVITQSTPEETITGSIRTRIRTGSTPGETIMYPEEDEDSPSEKSTTGKEKPTKKEKTLSAPTRKRSRTSTSMEMVSDSPVNKVHTSTPIETASEEESRNYPDLSPSETKVSQIPTRSTPMDGNIYDDDDTRRAGLDDYEIEVIRGLTPTNSRKYRKNILKPKVTNSDRNEINKKLKRQSMRVEYTTEEEEEETTISTTTDAIYKTPYLYPREERKKLRYINNYRKSEEKRGEINEVKSEVGNAVSLTLRRTLPWKYVYKETSRPESNIGKTKNDIEAHKENHIATQKDNVQKRIAFIKSYHVTEIYPEEDFHVRRTVSNKFPKENNIRQSQHYTIKRFLEDPRSRDDNRKFKVFADSERIDDQIKSRHVMPIPY